MTVSTMKSRVIDVVRENGFAVGDHDDLYPAANQPVHQSDTIVLRRGRPLQVSVDGQAEQAGVDDGLDCRRGPQAAVDERRRPRRGVSCQPIAAGRHGAAGGQREERAHRRRRCGQRPAPGGAQRGPCCWPQPMRRWSRTTKWCRRRRRRSPRACRSWSPASGRRRSPHACRCRRRRDASRTRR